MPPSSASRAFISGSASKNRVRSSYPNFSAALTTAGGLLFTGLGDGTFVAYDDVSLEPLWKINVGVGINAPPRPSRPEADNTSRS